MGGFGGFDAGEDEGARRGAWGGGQQGVAGGDLRLGWDGLERRRCCGRPGGGGAELAVSQGVLRVDLAELGLERLDLVFDGADLVLRGLRAGMLGEGSEDGGGGGGQAEGAACVGSAGGCHVWCDPRLFMAGGTFHSLYTSGQLGYDWVWRICVGVWLGGMSGGEGRPSFLKKRSKRLFRGAVADSPQPASLSDKSFLVLFCKKGLLALPYVNCSA